MNGVKNIVVNKMIDRYSKNTTELYKSGTRKRTMFSSDPVQIVENIFNGGKWLNTYEVPYFRK